MSNPTELRDKVASKAVTPANNGAKPTIFDIINRQKVEVRRALPSHMDEERFVRLVLTQVRQTPKLAECSPESLLGALMVSAQLGLEPGPLGHVWLIPRQNKGKWEVQLQLGYKGIIELARRSGQLTSIYAMEVREADEFSFEYGLNQDLHHTFDLRKPRGGAYAYYGVATFKDGGRFFLVLSREDVEKRRSRSASKDRGPWTTDYDAMAKKTVIRAMAPYLPLSPELIRAIDTDSTVRRQPLEADMTETFIPPEDSDDEVVDAELVPPADENGEPVAQYGPGEEPFDPGTES